MPRIKITDLPLLKDLTEEQLKELFGAGSRNYRPTFESLEDRQLMTAVILAPTLSNTQQALISSPIAQTSYVDPTTPVISIQDQTSTNPFATIQNQTLDPNTKIDTSFQPSIEQPDAALLATIGVGRLPGLPILNSNPGAKTTLYLNFTGSRLNADFTGEHVAGNLKGFHAVFDLDGDPTSFNVAEQQAITQIWAYVADDYAPFNVNVTTLSSQQNFGTSGNTYEVAIGGQTPPLITDPAFIGITEETGAFFGGGPHTSFIFSDTIRTYNAEHPSTGEYAKYVANVAAHEAGHAFGLGHQSDYNGDDLKNVYSKGTRDWGPIMGLNTGKRETWWDGPSADLANDSQSNLSGRGKEQDDIAFLATGERTDNFSTLGLGYRKDDVIGWQAMFESKDQPGEFFSSGFIGAPDGDGNQDWDSYRFESKGGPVAIQLNASGPNGNLRAELQLWRSDGRFMGRSARDEWTNSLTFAWLPAGTYFVGVGSTGGYGNLGTYWLHVSAPDPGQVHTNLSATGNLASLASTTGLSAQATVLNPLDAAFIQDEFAQTADFSSINQNMTVVPYSPQAGADAANVFATGLNQGQSTLTQNLQKQGQAAIDQLVRDLAGTWRAVGNPVGDGQPTAYGFARVQFFDNDKMIAWSPDTGAHMVDGLIKQAYMSNNGVYPLSAGGDFFNGYPTSEARSLNGWSGAQAVVQAFSSSTGLTQVIVWTQDHGAIIMSGPILQKWLALGGGSYGVPISPEYYLPSQGNASGQNFLLGGAASGLVSTIVSSDMTGTHDVAGAIRDSWISRGAGNFGTPVTDQTVFSPSGNTMRQIVHFNRLSGGNIGTGSAIAYLAYGPVAVVGNIYTAWISPEVGGADGFGWPGSEEHDSREVPDARVSTFISSAGLTTPIYWTSSDEYGSHFLVGESLKGGKVGIYVKPLDFTPVAGPTGFEKPDGPIGTSSALLTASPRVIPVDNLTLQSQGNPFASINQMTVVPYSPQTGSDVDYASVFQDLAPSADNVIDFPSSASYTPFTSDIGLDQEIISGLTPSNVSTPGAGLGRGIGSISPVFSLPQLDSNLGAAKTIYLDFLGGPVGQDFLYQNANAATTGGTPDAILNSARPINLRNFYVPTFDLDGKTGLFSAEEQAVIKEIWQRVAEDFAPFNVNVTTQWSGALNDPNMLRIIVGGPSITATGMADPYGLSQLNSVKQGGPNVVFVFSDAIKTLGGHFATLAANVASREAGHAFGLQYQTERDGTLDSKIMSTRIDGELSRWAQGSVPVAGAIVPNAWTWQDDLKTLIGALGYREQGPGSYGGFTNLGNVDSAGTVQGQGTIVIPFTLHQADDPGPAPVDVDTFIFDTQGGRIHFTAQGIGAGQNLRAHFEVWASDTKLGESPVLYGELNAALTLNLPAGTYTVKVMGSTDYGNYGKYTLSIQKGNIIDLTGAFQTRSALAPGQLQARLVELDQAIAHSQEDLQGALNLQAQYTTARDQVAADILAATEVSADETAPNLADLQANQAQIMTALDQNQEQISQLQTQLDLFTTEHTLISTTLADGDASRADAMDDFAGVAFSLTSLDTGDVHQLQIQDQSNYLPAVDAVRQQNPAEAVGAVRQEAPGAAQPAITFNALWDGSQVSGTLSRDEAGNVLVRFSSGSLEAGTLHLFNGTISGPAGAYHIEATDTLRGGGPSDILIGDQIQDVILPIEVVTTTVAVQSSSPAAGYGDAVTLTATVASDAGLETPSGVVTFYDNGVVIGTASLDASGRASITTTALGVGDHAITAGYDGDGNFQGSSTDSFTQTIAPAVTTTVVQSSSPIAGFGDAVTLTATVASGNAGLETPSGIVTFFDNGIAIGTSSLDANGQASIIISALNAGDHVITASYDGEGNFEGSTAHSLTQSITPAATTTVVQSSSPAAGYGEAVTLTATVSSAAGLETPSGVVTFFDNGVAIGTASVDANGQASITTSALNAGNHVISVSYDGEGNYQGSTDGITQTVTPAATQTALISSASKSVLGQAVVFTATVSTLTAGLSTPTGTVTFMDGATVLKIVTLNNGVAGFQTSALSLGTHSIIALYTSDNGNIGASGSTPLSQQVAKASKTTLTSSLATSTFGQAITLTATVSAALAGSGTPTGSVTFMDGSTVLGSATLSSGKATLITSALSAGSRAVTAVYNGNSTFGVGTSAVLAQKVTVAATKTTIATSLAAAVFGQAVTFKATIAVVAPGAGSPAGTVTFKDGATVLGSAAVSNGVASLSIATFTPGSHSITALFVSGSGNFAGSTSAALSQAVQKAATKATLTGPTTATAFGQAVTLTAKIAAVAPGAGMPTGTVTFKDGSTVIGTGTIVNGVATFPTSKLSKGSRTITVVYAGDADFLTSTSASVVVTIK